MANVIFDFDGTIADTLAIAIGIYEELLHKRDPLPAEEIERLRGMSMLQVGLELKIHPWKVPFLIRKGRKKMHARIPDATVFLGMPEMLRQLQAEGHKLFIMSSNSRANIHSFLEHHDMQGIFRRIYGNAGLFGKSNVMRRVMSRNRLKREATLYVGDEVRDVQAAKRAGVQMIAVTWGYNTREVLAAHHPGYLADRPKDIQMVVEKHTIKG